MNRIERSKIGRKSRAAGKAFEKKVRTNLESRGFLVVRNDNDVKEENGVLKFKQAKASWNPFTKRPNSISTGFPDFLVVNHTNVFFVESKMSKYLDAEEKKKVEWIRNNLGLEVVVAYKKKRGVI